MPNAVFSREHQVNKTSDGRPAPHKRRIEARLPSIEMKEEFVKDAEDRGGVSKFITYLYRQYKRAQNSDQNGEKKTA